MALQKKNKEKEILQNAITLFWKNGFHKTSIQDLVDYLGINRASLYNTYQDKEGLFTTCLIAYREQIFNMATETLYENKSIKKGFQDLFKFIIESIGKDVNKKGCLIANTYSELPSLIDNQNHNLAHETKDLWITLIKGALKKAEKNKEIKNGTNIQKSTHAIYTSMVGATILSKINTRPIELKNSLETHLNIFNKQHIQTILNNEQTI